MGDRETSVSYLELGRLEIRCQKCGTALVLDMGRERSDLAGNESFARQCPACREVFPQQAQSALMFYNRFQTDAKKAELDIRFRVQE